jgi:AcrR family transcriptional regulator
MQQQKETTPYRQALRERIIEAAMTAFCQSGIRAVKMDDIAKTLGISKRTLYEIYEDKEEVLYHGVRLYDQNKQEHLLAFAREHHVIDIIMEAYRVKAQDLKNISPLFFEDIPKYPKVAAYIKEQQEHGRQTFQLFMQRGVSEGFFRKEMNYEVISHLFDAVGKHIRNNELIKQFSLEELFVNMFLVAIRGFCTPRGIAAIDEALLKFSK